MARMGDHDLRTGGVGPTGLDAAHAARLPEHVLEARNGCPARRSRSADPSSLTNAVDYKIHRWQRPRICRSSVPICMYHDRLRRSLRFSFSDCFRHNAENAAARITNTQYRLWRDGDRNDGGFDGDDRGVRAATGRILRN